MSRLSGFNARFIRNRFQGTLRSPRGQQAFGIGPGSDLSGASERRQSLQAIGFADQGPELSEEQIRLIRQGGSSRTLLGGALGDPLAGSREGGLLSQPLLRRGAG